MTSPNSDCITCGGEGVDTDPYGCFDYECRGPCPDCWPEQEQVQVSQADRDAANALATEICGCATPEQRKRDVAAILAYRHTATSEALEAMREAREALGEVFADNSAVDRLSWIDRAARTLTRLTAAIAKIEGQQP